MAAYRWKSQGRRKSTVGSDQPCAVECSEKSMYLFCASHDIGGMIAHVELLIFVKVVDNIRSMSMEEWIIGGLDETYGVGG